MQSKLVEYNELKRVPVIMYVESSPSNASEAQQGALVEMVVRGNDQAIRKQNKTPVGGPKDRGC